METGQNSRNGLKSWILSILLLCLYCSREAESASLLESRHGYFPILGSSAINSQAFLLENQYPLLTNNNDDDPSTSGRGDESNEIFMEMDNTNPTKYHHPAGYSSLFQSIDEDDTAHYPTTPSSLEPNSGEEIAENQGSVVASLIEHLHPTPPSSKLGLNGIWRLALTRERILPHIRFSNDGFREMVKRSPACLKKCMAQGFLHPAQCHSLC